MSPFWALALALFCVLANAFFVAAEFAYAKVRSTSLDARARTGDIAAVRAVEIHKKLDAYLAATQFGITLASLALGAVGEPAIAPFIERPLEAFGAPQSMARGFGIAVSFGVVTLLHIVIGELVPKTLALLRPEAIAVSSGAALRAFYIVSTPALFVLERLSRAVLSLMRLPPMENAEGVLSLEEIRMIIDVASREGELERSRRDIVARVLRGADRTVKTVMVPRVDVITLALEDHFETSLQRVRHHGFSRYPVSETGEPDTIVGYVYVKDLLFARQLPRGGLAALRRDILIVPESRTIVRALDDMRRARIPIAVVVDEFGGTAGLVTLEDLVEEIVGDIQDEHDAEAPALTKTADGGFVVDGDVPLAELVDAGVHLDGVSPDETISAYVTESLGRLPLPGDRVRVGSFEAVVADVRRRRVERVILRPYLGASLPPQGTQVPGD